MKCTWCGREENLDKSPLFGVPVCDRCWEAEEEAYIEVIRDLEANIDKTHRWPMYWRVLEKVAENPWEHIPLIKLAKWKNTDIRELEDLYHLLHGGIGWWEERGYDDIAETGRKLLREVECTLRELGRHE